MAMIDALDDRGLDLLLKIRLQLGYDSIYAVRPETDARLEQKEERIEAIRAWVATLGDAAMKVAYGKVLDEAAASLRDWKRDMAEERARLAKIVLPELPPELRPTDT